MALREEKEFVISGKQKVSVREETNAVSDTRVMIVQNQHQKPLHPLSHQHKEEEVRASIDMRRTQEEPHVHYSGYSCTRKSTEPGYRHAGDNVTLNETRGTRTQTNTNEAGQTVCRGVCDAEVPIADRGKPDSFDTREKMGEQLLRPCRALAQTRTHALETAKISPIGSSDHDSSHASHGT